MEEEHGFLRVAEDVRARDLGIDLCGLPATANDRERAEIFSRLAVMLEEGELGIYWRNQPDLDPRDGWDPDHISEHWRSDESFLLLVDGTGECKLWRCP